MRVREMVCTDIPSVVRLLEIEIEKLRMSNKDRLIPHLIEVLKTVDRAVVLEVDNEVVGCVAWDESVIGVEVVTYVIETKYRSKKESYMLAKAAVNKLRQYPIVRYNTLHPTMILPKYCNQNNQRINIRQLEIDLERIAGKWENQKQSAT